MSEFFLELFSEEIPSSLQKNLREDLLNSFIKEFNEKSKIGRAHVRTPVTSLSRMPSSA